MPIDKRHKRYIPTGRTMARLLATILRGEWKRVDNPRTTSRSVHCDDNGGAHPSTSRRGRRVVHFGAGSGRNAIVDADVGR
jgi:hypothetical protein